MAPFIRECLPPSPPPMECSNTNIFGAPRLRPGRFVPNTTNEIPVSGIAVHCVKDTFDGYINKACTGLTKIPVGCHASVHYAIDADSGRISSLVHETDIAWAWQSYRSNFPITTPLNCCPCVPPCPELPCPGDGCTPETYPGWPVLSAEFPNLSADFYTINIAVTHPSKAQETLLDGETNCCGPYGMSDKAYAILVQLIAWIEFRYAAITLDAQHIKFHDEIVATDAACLECSCGANGSCLVCDVSKYCERCSMVPEPLMESIDSVAFVFVETRTGCRAKIALSDFKTLLGV